ncbi:apolipoprotein F-like [Nycticebus coucang]|uniref:apolipoprotein F-like n=1 Tax=Nycticebus coucang TaxID=9470 RepID=UPI00234C7A8B|nr:apolipoprotein F-like [Nycticebus coucang]XP_053419875.1 apolipoprotein F-like [Nycticebus coucang]
MMQTVLLLCFVLLSLVTAFPRNTQHGTLNFQPSFTETERPSNMLSSQMSLPDPRICQHLLHTAPSLTPLPKYLSTLSLRVVLEDIGCPIEAHILQLQLIRLGGKDTTETLIHESQKLNEEEGIGHANTVLRDLGGSPGDHRRVQRAVTLSEACTSRHGWVLYEIAMLMVEFAEKLPSTELVTEFKTSAINVTQKCTDESWVHLEEVGKRLMKSPELKNLTMPIEDQIYFVMRIGAILKHIILDLIQHYFQAYFG